MPKVMRQQNELFDFLLTQTSNNKQMPYDLIEKVIHSSIEYVKKHNINARISNVVLNIEGKLVLAQVYVTPVRSFIAVEKRS